MARFLLTPWSFPTHTYIFYAIGHALVAAGHQVAFYTAERERRQVEAIGAVLYPFTNVDQEMVDGLVDEVLLFRRRPRKLWTSWRQFLLGTVPGQLKDLERILAAFAPGVLIGDTAMWAPMLVLRDAAKLPTAVLSHIALSLQPGDSGPVPGRAMEPRQTAVQRLLAAGVTALSQFATADVRRESNRIRAAYGLPPTTLRMTETYSRMDLYLIPGTPSFDYARKDIPSSVQYIGACAWPPADWASTPKPSSQPHIIVEEGALYSVDPLLLRVAMEAFRDCPFQVTVLMGKGRSAGAIPANNIPPNITVRPWMPLQHLVQTAGAVVSTGNSDSVMAALAQAKPVLVVPSILDQAEVALRVKASGAGLRIEERDCTTPRLRNGVQSLLDNARYRDAAKRLSVELDQLGGPPRAVRLLEELVSRSRSRSVA